MSLIKSISGIRGTIGGKVGDNLTPLDVVKFSSAYATWLTQHARSKNAQKRVVVGRDGRMSGKLVSDLVISSLTSMGLDVLNLDYSTTPTVEMAVKFLQADGGIIITASHNGKEWNALKLLDDQGEFLDDEQGKLVLQIAETESFQFFPVDKLGKTLPVSDMLEAHINAILELPEVDIRAIEKKNFNIVLDAINSTGSIAVPKLLNALGVQNITVLNGEITGDFQHNPEPLPENLTGLSKQVTEHKAHVGIAVDPDVDRLCFVCEDGSMFGEEYTLVAVADYMLGLCKGNTVSNLSSTRALRDVTIKHGGNYTASAVGEVNVVRKMKATDAIIGGEGNGGVIVPKLHYGRDALAGIALFLTHLAKSGLSMTGLRKIYPDYHMSKNKINLEPGTPVAEILHKVQAKYANQLCNTLDGLKIDFENDWVHLRSSNTEPVIRIYAESISPQAAENLAHQLMNDIREVI